jgi:hypothetical protein
LNQLGWFKAFSPRPVCDRMLGMAKRQSAEEMLRDLMRKNASLGGKARIGQLTAEERRALARKAGKASGAARRRKAKARPMTS